MSVGLNIFQEHVGNHSMKHTFTRAGQRALGGDLVKLKKMTRHRSMNALSKSQ